MLRKLLILCAPLACALVACVPEVVPVLELSQDAVEVATDCQSIVLDVSCNVVWTTQMAEGEWVKIASETQDEVDHSGQIKLRFSVNETYETRTDTLIVTAGSLVKKVPVSQTGIASILSTSQVTIVDLEPVTFAIDTKLNWSASPVDTKGTPSWFTISPSSSSPGYTEIKVTPKESNVDVGDRNAFIKIEMGGRYFYVTVTQKQKDAILLSADKVELTNKESTFALTVRTNIDYAVALQPDCSSWISTVSTKALNEYQATFKAKANPDDQPRRGTIVISGNGLSDTVKVYQAERDILVLSGTGVTLDYKGGSFNVDLKTNVEYGVTIVGGDGWLTETGSSQNRVDRRSFYAGANSTMEERTAQIVFKDINSSLSQIYTVTQASAAADPFYTSDAPGIYGFSDTEWSASGDGVQTAFLEYSKVYTYRIIWPLQNKIVEVRKIPKTLALGGTQDVVVAIVEGGRSSTQTLSTKVVMIRDGMAWLATDGEKSLIIEMPEEL